MTPTNPMPPGTDIPFFLLALFAVTGLFIFCHPLLAIIACAINKQHEQQTKIIWILVSIFLGPLGSIAYGIFGTTSSWLRWTTVAAIVLCFASLLGLQTHGERAEQRKRFPTVTHPNIPLPAGR